MKKIGFGIILLFSSFQLITAQPQYKHEFSFSLGGGASTLYPKIMNIGDYKLGVNENASLEYTCFLGQYVGISSGITATQYRSEMKIPSFADSYSANDGVDNFIYTYSLENLTEKQDVIYLRIPLMFQFQTSGYNRFYLKLGGAIGLPVYQKYNTKLSTLTTSAYYSQWDVHLNAPQFRGLGTFENLSTKRDLDLDFSYTASAEMGMKWTVDEDFYIYTGIYADYGINNIIKKGTVNKNLVDYNAENPYPIVVNSMLQSVVTQNNAVVSCVDKINPISAGIKVRISYGFGKFIGKRSKPASSTQEYIWK